MSEYKDFIDGYKEFRNEYLSKPFGAYRKWAATTHLPKMMIIACSDSRINPAILTHAGLGEIFMVNNVANIVPPYKEGKNTHHSTSSAIEYAVQFLKVKHIVIMGHSGCGGINALLNGINKDTNDNEYSFIEPWIDIVAEAKEYVQKEMKEARPAEMVCECEKKSILISYRNLTSFPFVQKAINSNELQIHAWYFDITEAILYEYNDQKQEFESVL